MKAEGESFRFHSIMEILPPTITIEKEDDGNLAICVSHCEVFFDGSKLQFDGVDENNIEYVGVSGEQLTQFWLLWPQTNQINLAYIELPFTLEIKNCQIKNTNTVPYPIISFQGTSIRLENFSVPDSDIFSFELWIKGRKYVHEIKGLNEGRITLYPDGCITARNIKVTSSDRNAVVDVTKNHEARWIVQQSKDSIQIVSGKIRSLEVAGLYTIEIKKGSSVTQLNMQNMGVFHGIQSDSDSCTIERANPDAACLKLYSLNHIEAIDIGQRIEGFLCDTCDFSKTRIQFSENASLSFKPLESTATLWNPSLITYRGFCPSRLKETKKINGIPAARQFFCEMKTFFSNKGDSITAGEFHAAEMIAQRRYLQISRKEKGKGLIGYLSLYTDLFVMFLSHHSSTFGQNLFRAISSYLLLGFIFSLLFFCLGNLCPSCYQGEYFWSNFDCSSFLLFFLHVLSPLNLKLDDIGLGLVSSWKLTLSWMLWKIIGGFLVFQIISSSRRFIRKW